MKCVKKTFLLGLLGLLVSNCNVSANQITIVNDVLNGGSYSWDDAREDINDNFTELYTDKSDKTNVIEKDSETAFTPTQDTHPANKLYVDTQVATKQDAMVSDENYVTDAEKSAIATNSGFRTTPSTVITAGNNIEWDGSTLNVTAGAGTLDTTGTITALDIPRFSDTDSVEGLSYQELVDILETQEWDMSNASEFVIGELEFTPTPTFPTGAGILSVCNSIQNSDDGALSMHLNDEDYVYLAVPKTSYEAATDNQVLIIDTDTNKLDFATVTGAELSTDTFPAYSDSAHSSGIAWNDTTLAIYTGETNGWMTVALSNTLGLTPSAPTLSTWTIGTTGELSTLEFSDPVTASDFSGFSTVSPAHTLTNTGGIGTNTLTFSHDTVYSTATDNPTGSYSGTGVSAVSGGGLLASFTGVTIDNQSTQTAGGVVSFVSGLTGPDSGVNPTCNLPAGASEGDLLLTYVLIDEDTTLSWDTTGGAWTPITSIVSSTSKMYAAWKVASSSEPATYTHTSGVASGSITIIQVFSKSAGTFSVSDFDQAAVTGTELTIPGIDIISGGVMSTVFGSDGNVGVTGVLPATMTENPATTTVSSIRTSHYYETFPAGSAGESRVATYVSTDDQTGISIAIGAQ